MTRQAGRHPAGYFTLALLWGATLYWFGGNFHSHPPWLVFAGVVVYSLPILLGGLYLTTVRKIRNLAGFASEGWLYQLFSGRILATLFWAVWAPSSTFLVLLQFRTCSAQEWLAFSLVIPIFYGVFLGFDRAVRGELRRYHQVASALRLALWTAPLLGLLVYVLVLTLGASEADVATFRAAIALNAPGVPVASSSALVYALSQLLAVYEGAKLFASTHLGEPDSLLALGLLALGGWFVFLNAATMLAAFVVPLAEYRRVFARLSDSDDPPAPELSRVMVTSAIGVIAVLFIALPAFSALESHARRPDSTFAKALEASAILVVRIDGVLYRQDVVPRIKALQLEKARQLEAFHPRLEQSLERAFVIMAGNVDPFLDWYYGLSAEYLRTANLLRGQLDDYVEAKLIEYLQQGQPFSAFEMLIGQAVQQQAALEAEFNNAVEGLLNEYRLLASNEADLTVVGELSLATLITLPSPEESIPLSMRMGTGGAAGVVSTAVVAKVVGKLYAKGVVKLAAKPLAKAFAGRVAAVGSGAAAGAVAGSVVPGLGTAAGAIVGGAIGLAAGVGVDFALLKLEESISRDQFREDLMAAIDEIRNHYREEMRASKTGTVDGAVGGQGDR